MTSAAGPRGHHGCGGWTRGRGAQQAPLIQRGEADVRDDVLPRQA